MAVACLKLNPLMACSASNFMLTFLKSRTFPIEEEEEKKPTELNITAGEKKYHLFHKKTCRYLLANISLC